MKKKLLFYFLVQLGVADIAVAEDCGPRDVISEKFAVEWMNESMQGLLGKSFKNTGNLRDRKNSCTIVRILTFATKLTGGGRKLTAQYSMTSRERNCPHWGQADVEITTKLSRSANTYDAKLVYDTVYVNGYSGLESLKDTTDKGTLCFYPGGRLSFQHNLYTPTR